MLRHIADLLTVLPEAVVAGPGASEAASGASGVAVGILAAVFVVSALVVGRGDGLRCLLALGWCGAISATSAQASSAGWLHPLGALVGCAVLCLLGVTLCMLSPTRRAVGALLGAGVAFIAAGGGCAFFVWRLRLTGIFNTTMRDLWYGGGTRHLGPHWIVLGGMMVAGVGCICDLAIAVVSTMAEVQAANPAATRRELMASGLRLGGDVTGTEINTLVFALVGLNLGAVLLPLASPDVRQAPVPWLEVINRQSVSVEVVAALAGTIGMVLAIPLTALIGAALLKGGGPRASH